MQTSNSKVMTTRVLERRELAPGSHELRLERNNLAFQAGELLTLYGADHYEGRDYTLASGEEDETLDIVFKVIPKGALTPRLAALKAGDSIDIAGPYGTFTLRDRKCPIVFIATGTGIAPCRSFVRSYPGLDLQIVQGARTVGELYYRDEFEAYRYLPCVSREVYQGKQRRPSAAWDEVEITPDTHFYLCGANEMIYEAMDWLAEQDVTSDRVFHEAYYYRMEL